MELGRLLEELTHAAERAGITVRTEPFDPNLSDIRRPRGGLCTLRGQRLILIDANLPLPERVATMAEALASGDREPLFLPPIVRATIGTYRAGDDALWPPNPANDPGPPPRPLPPSRAKRREPR